ncbi:hypothetical protein KBY97_00270 [Synechococcus sp. ATX 2A4]|nr:hypothetical protein [Synechococcus sp. ATX 2A4]
MRFPLKFNFPPRHLPPESGRWLAAISASRWLLPLGIAVGAHALWLSGSSVAERPRPPAPRLQVTDNTPELLRFSSGARQPMALAASLSTIELPFGNSLPLPPPPPPPPLESSAPQGGRPVAAVAAGPRSAASSGVSSGPSSGLAWGVVPAVAPGLPATAATALELAALLNAKAERTAAGTAEGPAEVTPALAERPANAHANKAASSALARRHLRLDANTNRPYQLLWDTGSAASSQPESLADLPEGVEVRRLPLAAAQAMGLSKPHGITVKSPTGLLLLWVQGDQLWLVRQPGAVAKPAA